ncbi:MAG TPA: hypothetical protein VGK18_09215 [Propionicimonas sp.]|uniref:hypothetical protein n=1 Tax=Propionicimonas sp. TaxID=1955623 RepID=UPI002F3E49A6
MLIDPEQWIWDSWIADDGDRYHLFYLQAPRALGDAGLRHTHAVIGHASSSDLVTWTRHGVALRPGTGGWDDLALWTGSVVRGDDGVWRMFYTAINTGGRGVKDQRIGVAVSEDLMTWNRFGRAPVAEADPRWYTTLDGGRGPSETWRDPLVIRDPDGAGWHMLICARAVGAGRNDDGVIGHARSTDLRTWHVGPPITAPGAGFGQLEVAQVRVVDGAPLLVFTCHPQEQTAERIAAAGGEYCTWSVRGESLLGPWDISRAQPFRPEPDLFAAPLVAERAGGWVLLGFRNTEPRGVLAFELLDPIPVRRDGDELVLR